MPLVLDLLNYSVSSTRCQRDLLLKVDGVHQLAKGLHNRAAAAPEAVQGRAPPVPAVTLVIASTQGHQVDDHTCRRSAVAMNTPDKTDVIVQWQLY